MTCDNYAWPLKNLMNYSSIQVACKTLNVKDELSINICKYRGKIEEEIRPSFLNFLLLKVSSSNQFSGLTPHMDGVAHFHN